MVRIGAVGELLLVGQAIAIGVEGGIDKIDALRHGGDAAGVGIDLHRFDGAVQHGDRRHAIAVGNGGGGTEHRIGRGSAEPNGITRHRIAAAVQSRRLDSRAVGRSTHRRHHIRVVRQRKLRIDIDGHRGRRGIKLAVIDHKLKAVASVVTSIRLVNNPAIVVRDRGARSGDRRTKGVAVHRLIERTVERQYGDFAR